MDAFVGIRGLLLRGPFRYSNADVFAEAALDQHLRRNAIQKERSGKQRLEFLVRKCAQRLPAGPLRRYVIERSDLSEMI